ncbi:hypothetical protein [Rubrimonas cliftonensis]|uniref:Uncharacterized protein n=1 Tax=Rubrimonas cliftonensis TaxID=89524 RepID=A0A1H3YRC2_9RHOB|nr:hypothetical protein [Rubrimonas cliftonensis]SEA13582.1 hypothetical protein SAMN05444370_103196 [Rubrimonas cliftonensis]
MTVLDAFHEAGARRLRSKRGWAALADDGGLIVTVWEDRQVCENAIAFAFLAHMGGEVAAAAEALGIGGRVRVIHKLRDRTNPHPCMVSPWLWEIFGLTVCLDGSGTPRRVLALLRTDERRSATF